MYAYTYMYNPSYMRILHTVAGQCQLHVPAADKCAYMAPAIPGPTGCTGVPSSCLWATSSCENKQRTAYPAPTSFCGRQLLVGILKHHEPSIMGLRLHTRACTSCTGGLPALQGSAPGLRGSAGRQHTNPHMTTRKASETPNWDACRGPVDRREHLGQCPVASPPCQMLGEHRTKCDPLCVTPTSRPTWLEKHSHPEKNFQAKS